MARPALKFQSLLRTLQHRIERGDYSLRAFPSERNLAKENGVSYMTARKAVLELIDQRILIRGETGRIGVADRPLSGENRQTIVFLLPAWDSPAFSPWQSAIYRVVHAKGIKLRVITYEDEHDPELLSTLNEAFTGIILIPPVNPVLPPLIREHFLRNNHRMVTLFHDLTDLGIPTVDQVPANAVDLLIDHLWTTGHARVDCINCETSDTTIQERIRHWESSSEKKSVKGQLLQSANPGNRHSGKLARDLMLKLWKKDKPDKSIGYFCTSVLVAMGVIRAGYECGFVAGRDYSICAFGVSESVKLMTPSLAVLDAPPKEELIEAALNWFDPKKKRRIRSLHIEPPKVGLWAGESIIPKAAKGKRSV